MAYKKGTKKHLTKKRLITAAFVAAFFVFLGFSFPYSGIVFEYLPGAVGGLQEKETVRHIKTPNEVRGIYMTSWVASTDSIRRGLVKIAEDTEINAIVIDIKDYTGKVAFLMKNQKVKEAGSSEDRVKDMKKFIEELHSKNIYVIGRIAVFQDPYLAKARPDLAVKRSDGVTNWKDYKGMLWLDPCSKEVWDYTIAIAREAESIGFDELNFDYIRFPSDGNMKDIKYPHCDATLTKPDLLENFFYNLKKGLNDLSVPLSADLFGMVATNFDDLNIGQVLERTEPYFDYVSPMVYPSHYPKDYNGFANPAAKPYEVIKLSMDSAVKRLLAASSSPFKLRPWLQDFDLGANYDAVMIRKEKQAVYDAGLNSWLMWSPSNRYTVEALDKN